MFFHILIHPKSNPKSTFPGASQIFSRLFGNLIFLLSLLLATSYKIFNWMLVLHSFAVWPINDGLLLENINMGPSRSVAECAPFYYLIEVLRYSLVVSSGSFFTQWMREEWFGRDSLGRSRVHYRVNLFRFGKLQRVGISEWWCVLMRCSQSPSIDEVYSIGL